MSRDLLKCLFTCDQLQLTECNMACLAIFGVNLFQLIEALQSSTISVKYVLFTRVPADCPIVG